MTTNDTPLYRKEIVYDRASRDYAMYLNGELVGFDRTYHEAEVTLDQLVLELSGFVAGWSMASGNDEVAE